MPREKLTDQQRKQIIADYVQTGNYCAVARAHGINDTTVRRIVLADPDTAEKAEQKKNQNTADILAFMHTRKDKVCKAIDGGIYDKFYPYANTQDRRHLKGAD